MERELLVAAAKELNEVLGLSPAMNLKAPKKELIKQFRANLEEILPEDSFSKETTKVINHYLNKAKKVETEEDVDDDTTGEQEEVVKMTPEKKEKKEMKEIKIKQEEAEVEAVEREVTDFEESFDKAIEEEMKGPRKKTLNQKKADEKSKQAKVAKALVLEKRAFVAALIEEGTHTKAEIMDLAIAKYPDWNPVSLSTMLTDGSNPRYNVFDALVLKDKDTKLLSFVKEG